MHSKSKLPLPNPENQKPTSDSARERGGVAFRRIEEYTKKTKGLYCLYYFQKIPFFVRPPRRALLREHITSGRGFLSLRVVHVRNASTTYVVIVVVVSGVVVVVMVVVVVVVVVVVAVGLALRCNTNSIKKT